MSGSRPSACAHPHLDAKRFDADQLRAALFELANSPEYLRSAQGSVLLRQLELHVAPTLLALGRRVGIDRSWLEPLDVVHTIVLALCHQRGSAARQIAETALDPWPYLLRCAAGWVRALWGVRGEAITGHTLLGLADPTEEEILTPMKEVIERAHALLAPHTEAHLRNALLRLVAWLAENPPQRMSHDASERAEASFLFPAFSTTQIAAVANICWGGRPRRHETSLLAALLLDSGFRPADSPSHARALLHYRRTMRLRSTLQGVSERLAA